MMRMSGRGCVVFLLLMTAGCGGGEVLSPVTGKVLVNGKPAVGASLLFYPDGPPDIKAMPGSAVVDADGSFTVFNGSTPGIKAGKYIVTVVWPDPAKKPTDLQRMAGANPNDAPDVLNGRFATRDKSTLRADIKPGPNALEPFDLK